MNSLEARPVRAGRFWRTSAVALASALVAMVGLIPTTASAITRSDVLTRAQAWVRKRIGYSQQSYFQGYRRDCSGFVSMAWRVGRSYTSSTLHAIARRIPLSQLKPGDAVHTPGHVAIFVKWHNKARGLYVAMEQTTWGQTAKRHVRTLGSNATALRYRSITDPILVAGADGAAGSSAGSTVTASVPGSGPTVPVFPASIGLLATSSLETTISSFATEFVALFDLSASSSDATVPAPAGASAPSRLALVPLY